MNTPATRTRNCMTLTQNYKLCNAIQALNAAGGITSDSTWLSIAKYCQDLLGFPVTGNNIRGAFDVLELKMPTAPESREQQLELRIAELELIIKNMRTAVHGLCAEIGYASPVKF